jgi:hypothetical protein
LGRHFPHSYEGAKTVCSYWTFIFDSVAAFNMLSFSFFKQAGFRGHTNPHGHPHFFYRFSLVGKAEEMPGRTA